MISSRRRFLAITTSAMLATSLADALAQGSSFPNRAITIVVPFPAGGISDVITRHIAQAAGPILGQQVLIDNKPGAGGQIGADSVKRAKPDGYTLYLANIGSHAINETLYEKLSYDPVRDFEPVIGLFSSANLLLVNASNPARSVNDVLNQARAQAGKFSYGSQGVGSGGHLSGVIFQARAGVDLVHVPYRGSGPALVDLVGDRIGLLFDPLINAMPFVRDGKLRALAITSAQRSPLFPEVPTLRELGIADNDVNPWFGLTAPAGTPSAVIARLNEAFNRGLIDPGVRARLSAQAIDPIGGSAVDFDQFMRTEAARWKPVVIASGARPE